MPDIDPDLCKGCNLCIEFCPKKVFQQSKKQNASGYYIPDVKNPQACTKCGLCELMCPDFAISIKRNETPSETKKNNKPEKKKR